MPWNIIYKQCKKTGKLIPDPEEKQWYSEPKVDSDITITDKDCEYLLEERKNKIQAIQQMKKDLKELRGCKSIKETMRENEKELKGLQFVIAKCLTTPPGDCLGIQENKDTAPYIDREWAKLAAR